MSNVGFATLQVIPSAKGFKAALGREVDAPLAAAGKSGGRKAGREAGRGLSSGLLPVLGKLAPMVGAAFAGVAVGGFLKGAISEASNLSESVNAVNVSYGDAAKGVLALGDNAAKSFGLSKLQLNEFAVKFSGFAGSIAGETGDAAKVFEGITSRATDFASVMNLEVADAAALFQSGLAGESEPLRKYGIDMSAAAVEAYALAEGIGAAGKPLTEQQKVQARYGLLLKQTAKTQGDFKNTSGGLANQQKILGAQWADLKAKVGDAFLPVMARLVTLINDKVIPTLEKWAENLAPAMKAFGDFLSGLGGGEGVIGGVSKTLDKLKGPLGVAAEFFGDFADAVVAALPALLETGRSIAAKLVPAIKNFLPTLLAVGRVIFETVAPALLTLAKFVRDKILPALLSFAEFVYGQILPAILGFAKTVIDNVLPAVKVMAETFRDRIVPALMSLVEAVIGFVDKAKPFVMLFIRIVGLVVSVASKIIGFLIPIMLKFAGPIFSFLIRMIVKVIGWVGGIIGWVGKFGLKILDSGETIKKWAKGVGERVGSIVQWFKDLPGKIARGVGGLGKLLVQKGKDLINGLLDGAGSILGKIGEFFLNKVPKFIREPFKKALGINSPSTVFAGYGKNVGQGFVKGLASQSGAIKTAVAGLGADASISPTLAIGPPGVPNVGGAGPGGAGGRGFAPTIVNNYPAPEKASDSLTVSLRRAAFAMGV